ncbi:DNA-binding protein [Pengzhenrongella sp.]|jgi:hypothetical protein|uniref:DNA-binding protein n=1 Tax=Pengzhenrongella sp. TaxID=2888820 RepID=UPI002F957FE3
MDLVGITEIARMLNVSRQRAHQLAQTEGFPAPAAELSSGRVWETAGVEAWALASGRRASAVAGSEES